MYAAKGGYQHMALHISEHMQMRSHNVAALKALDYVEMHRRQPWATIKLVLEAYWVLGMGPRGRDLLASHGIAIHRGDNSTLICWRGPPVRDTLSLHTP